MCYPEGWRNRLIVPAVGDGYLKTPLAAGSSPQQ
jgi:hypothetical protein